MTAEIFKRNFGESCPNYSASVIFDESCPIFPEAEPTGWMGVYSTQTHNALWENQLITQNTTMSYTR